MSNNIKINMGCGPRNFGKGWVHIDGGDYDHLDFHDITKLNFENNSVDLIYSSHVIEYFDREEIIPVLREWYRVLKPNGVLRIAVPDFDKMIWLYWFKNEPLTSFLGPLYGKMKMKNKNIYHKTVYNYDNLVKLLKSIGLRKITKYKWSETEHFMFDDHSQAFIPHMDKKNGTLISLNVEGIK